MSDNYSENLENYFQSRLVLPPWVTQAFEYTYSVDEPQVSPAATSCQTRVLPAPSSEELEALIIILNTVQRQILSAQRVEFPSVDYEPLFINALKTKRFQYKRFLQLLPHMSLLRSSDKETETISLFETSTMSLQQDESALTYRLTPSAIGAELLLGLCDAYADLSRKLADKATVHEFNHLREPTFLQKSAWLELKKFEKILLLRIESIGRDSQALLQLDGTVGVGFDQLLEGIEIPERKPLRGYSQFLQNLEALRKVGQKLQAHGVLSARAKSDFIALRPNDNSLQISWLPGFMSVQDQDEDYIKACAGFFKSKRQNNPRMILDMMSGNLKTRILEDFENCYRLCISQDQPGDYFREGHKVYLLLDVFAELYLRAQPEHTMPLPTEIQAMEFVRQLAQIDLKKTEVFAKTFFDFCKLTQESHYYIESLLSTPMTCLASTSNWKRPDFIKLRYQKPNTKKEVVKTKAKEEKRTAKTAKTAPELTIKRSKKKQSMNMLKVATDELAQLRHDHYVQYCEIRQSYIMSLDDGSRKVMLDIQKRMQPEMFDDHIRDRLVNFMIENPGAWKTMQTPRTEVTRS